MVLLFLICELHFAILLMQKTYLKLNVEMVILKELSSKKFYQIHYFLSEKDIESGLYVKNRLLKYRIIHQ